MFSQVPRDLEVLRPSKTLATLGILQQVFGLLYKAKILFPKSGLYRELPLYLYSILHMYIFQHDAHV